MSITRLTALTALSVMLAGEFTHSRCAKGCSRVSEGAAGRLGSAERGRRRYGQDQKRAWISPSIMTNEPSSAVDELDADETLASLPTARSGRLRLERWLCRLRYPETHLGLAAGAGRGVAVSRAEIQPRIYMNMATAGVGMSLGLGGFETQVAILFRVR